MKVPVTIITGFLGAGKTTVISNLLKVQKEKKIALIINEFGDLGVDLELINGCKLENCETQNFIELANGCICCTVADDFLPTMAKLLDQKNPPEHIVIETSGLALPKPLVKAFNWPEVKSRATVDSVIAVVDSKAVFEGRFAENPEKIQKLRETDQALDHESPLEEVFEDQVLCADMILLNKSDLLNENELEVVKAAVVKNVRSCANILPISFGEVNPAIILGIGAAAEDSVQLRRSHHDGEEEHDHDDFESFVIEIGDVIDPEDLVRKLRLVTQSHDILRVKGFIHVEGKDMRNVIQGVGTRINRYYDRPWGVNEKRKTSLVIIGQSGLDKLAIQQALR